MIKKAMKQAIVVLKTCHGNLFLKDYVEHIDQSIKALEEALAKQELLFEVDGEMLTASQVAGVALFDFQEATGCNTAEEFKSKQEQGEPVAWVNVTDEGKWYVQYTLPKELMPEGTKFYTTPQQHKPLTDEQIMELWPFIVRRHETQAFIKFAKSIEAAHGIKE